MPETSAWWTTDGTGDGKVGGYTRADHSLFMAVIAACCGHEGIAPGYGSELAASVGGANTVTVAAGGAMVDGKPYDNSVAVNVNIPSASGAGNTRIDRIVARADWTAQTVRITRIEGVDAATPSPPAITQDSGNVYDITICQALVDTVGDVDVTDERTWAATNAHGLAADAVTTTKIQDAAVITDKLANDAVTDSKLRNSAAVSVIGRAANSVGNPGDIVAPLDGTTLRNRNNVLEFGMLHGAEALYENSVGNTRLRQSDGCSVIGRAANSLGNVADIIAAANDRVLARVSNALSWVQLTIGMIPDALITEAKLAAAVAAKLVTNGNSHNHVGGDGAVIPAGGLADGAVDTTARLANAIVTEAKLDAATAAKLVSNGNSHDHVGGDGATITAAAIANRTRRFLAGINTFGGDDAFASNGGVALHKDSQGYVHGAFRVPADFAADMTVKAVVMAQYNGNVRIRDIADAQAVGEDYGVHTTDSGWQTVGYSRGSADGEMAIRELQSLSLAAVGVGDYVVLWFSRDGANAGDTLADYLIFLGWIVEYTADS